MSKKIYKTFEEWRIDACRSRNENDPELSWQAACDSKQAEIDELKQQLKDSRYSYDHLSSEYRNLNKCFGEYQKENESLKKKLDKAEEVIRFYGDKENYHERNEDVFDYILSDVSFENNCCHGGKRARAYLKESEG